MEGNPDQPASALIPFFWSPGWNSIQAVNKYQREIAGPLRGGAAGVRLIEPRQDGMAFFSSIPSAFQARNDEWLVVPLFHIFGSEEFSRSAPAVAEVCSQPYVGMSLDDAGAFGPEAELLGRRLPVNVVSGLPKGVAGLPSGLPGLEGLELPAWSRITRV
jgi:NADH-quinone oxidoreductase subunit G